MDITGNAVIFGGGAGIGRATCLALAEAGARGILIADINLGSAQDVAAEIKTAATNPGCRAEAIHVDVALEESVNSVLKQMVHSFGRIDYCVVCAGVAMKYNRDITNSDVADFIRVQNINVNGTYFVLRAVLAIMKSQEPRSNFAGSVDRGVTRGSVITLGSIMSCSVESGTTPYTTSKHAVLGLTKNAALDSAKHGIRVNCVCPDWVETGMIKQYALDNPSEEATVSRLGRLGRPEEIADAIVFLCSPRSSFVTGCPFIVDGGATLCHK
ncbi:NAD(P)-binding protein [Hypoxylon cercidicola]|nr:NAD(P)-binding protein [Hypoxylon cercidicola]